MSRKEIFLCLFSLFKRKYSSHFLNSSFFFPFPQLRLAELRYEFIIKHNEFNMDEIKLTKAVLVCLSTITSDLT